MITRLPAHEWCIILLFCLILLALAGFAFNRPKATLPPITLAPIPPPTELQVKIEGQVAKPGLYRLPLQSTLKQLLEQAEPLPTADLSQSNGRRKLRDGQTIRVPERHLVTIQITGAVEQPGALQIMSGTRCCELAEQLHVLPDADLRALRKKRSFIKEGTLIEVPFKKQRKKENPKR